MDLTEFEAAVPTTLASFREATERYAQMDPAMNPGRQRPESWWYRDVGAYLEYLEAEEELRQKANPPGDC